MNSPYHSGLSVESVPSTLILAGINGGGKGTQGKKLKRDFGYTQVEMGGLLRKDPERLLRDKDGVLRPASYFMEKGILAPDDEVAKLVGEFMDSTGDNARFLFDGYPRNVSQANAMDAMLDGRGVDDARLVYLKVSEAAARKQMAFRFATDENPRKDDGDAEAVDKRINTFFKETMPVVDHYDARGQLITVSGESSMDLEHAMQVFNRRKELRSEPILVNGHVQELQDLEGQWAEIQAQLEASIKDVYSRILEAMHGAGVKGLPA